MTARKKSRLRARKTSTSASKLSARVTLDSRLPVRRTILERRTYEAPAEGRSNKIRLDFNENTSGCSPAVRKALAKITAKQLAMYPEYLQPTKRIARHLGVRPEELLLANGGDDALRIFFDTFVDPGTSILICEPTFPMYRYYAEIAGAQIVALHYDPNMQFPLVDALAAVRKDPRVLFIANPNNPTGTLIPRDSIRTILQAVTNTAVVIDEAYADFSGVTVIPWIRQFPHLFVVRTFSKAAGLAALRLGAVIAHRDSLQLLRRAMPPFPVNLMALVAAEAALRDRAAIRKYVSATLRIRKDFTAKLSLLGVTTYPSAGNFILADFGPKGPALFAKLALAGILVRERTKEIAPGFVRITIGTKSEMARVIVSIRNFAKQAGIQDFS
jgi:histidinol-phosphate aminotransferase